MDSLQIDRRKLTFSQAEGLERLPPRLKPGELPNPLRNALWNAIYLAIKESTNYTGFSTVIVGDWEDILFSIHVDYLHRPADEFKTDLGAWTRLLKSFIYDGLFNHVIDLIQFILRHHRRPPYLARVIQENLRRFQAAYELTDNLTTFVRVSSPEEAQSVHRAFVDLAAVEYGGARTHLREACEAATRGHHSDCIREAIGAVESVAKCLAGTESSALKDAILQLEKKGVRIQGAFRSGLLSLYGYTSDEKGIRHALLEESEAAVDAADAQFMLGACASFVSYLIAKGRAAGLLN